MCHVFLCAMFFSSESVSAVPPSVALWKTMRWERSYKESQTRALHAPVSGLWHKKAQCVCAHPSMHPCTHTLEWSCKGFLNSIISDQSHWSGRTFAKLWERGVVHTRGARSSREACFCSWFSDMRWIFASPLALPLLCIIAHADIQARIVCNPTTQWIKPVKKCAYSLG